MGDQKLVVCIMGQNCEKFLPMCLESVKDADAIVYCDGGSTDKTLDIFQGYVEIPNEKNKGIAQGRIISQKYDQEDITMNGKQRNFYLNYLKQNYPNDWALVLDADEVVDNLGKIKEFIQTATPGLYSVHMRHLMTYLNHEDSMTDKHYVLNRLFKISEASNYPEVEHPVLQPFLTEDKQHSKCFVGNTDCTVIWHLAYIPGLWDIKKRYENHMKKSNMHTPEYLKNWYYAHLFGNYPKKQFDPVELPEIILKEFHVDKEELYFQSRGIEVKNVVMVRQWNEFFNPQSLLDLGCGRGPYLYFWEMLVPGKVEGYELSKWAVEHAFTDKVKQRDISEDWNLEFPTGKQGKELVQIAPFDLITAVDVLEHLTDEQLIKTLKNMYNYGNKFLFSIPFVGDPNLENDKTHIQKHTKQKWIYTLENIGFKISEPPEHFLFKHQILVGIK